MWLRNRKKNTVFVSKDEVPEKFGHRLHFDKISIEKTPTVK